MLKKRRAAITYLGLGIGFMLFSIGLIIIFMQPEYAHSSMFGAGFGGFASSLYLIIIAIRAFRNKEFGDKFEIKEHDERRVQIRNKAASVTFSITITACLLASAISYFFYHNDYGIIFMGVLSFIIIVYGLSYFVYSKIK